MRESMRLDVTGTVAEPLALELLREVLIPSALAGVPQLALLGPVHGSIKRGTSERRSRAALVYVGAIVRAVGALLVVDPRSPQTVAHMRETVRALPPVALDAVDDVLGVLTTVRALCEAERMWRAGVLAHDWQLTFAQGSDRILSVVLMHPRRAVGQA